MKVVAWILISMNKELNSQPYSNSGTHTDTDKLKEGGGHNTGKFYHSCQHWMNSTKAEVHPLDILNNQTMAWNV